MTIQWKSSEFRNCELFGEFINLVTMSNQPTIQGATMPLSFTWGMKFPLGDDTFVTIKRGATQPVIEISSYEHFKTPSGHDVVIPKHLGAMLTPKQFTQLVEIGPSIQSAIKDFTQPKPYSPQVTQVKNKTKPKDKDSKTLKPRVGCPLKRRRVLKKNKEAKKPCTTSHDKNLMKVFSEVPSIEPFMSC